MPPNEKKPKATAATTVAETADDTQTTVLDERDEEITDLKRKLALANSFLFTDQVILGGVSYAVLTTVRADNTFHEVKRGHVDEGLTMVVINKQH